MSNPVYSCFVCGNSFEWGHDTWPNGRLVKNWKEMICKYCDQRDGIFPDPGLIAKLKSKGIAPEFNEAGFIIPSD